jgi:hypothetical protein
MSCRSLEYSRAILGYDYIDWLQSPKRDVAELFGFCFSPCSSWVVSGIICIGESIGQLCSLASLSSVSGSRGLFFVLLWIDCAN